MRRQFDDLDPVLQDPMYASRFEDPPKELSKSEHEVLNLLADDRDTSVGQHIEGMALMWGRSSPIAQEFDRIYKEMADKRERLREAESARFKLWRKERGLKLKNVWHAQELFGQFQAEERAK